MLTISGKTLGQKKPLFADFSIPITPEGNDEEGLTLRRLIERIVRQEIAAFEQRQMDRQLIQCLTASQIDDAVERGKIHSGGSDLRQQVDLESAISAALQAFEDGIYLVVLDGTEQRELDRRIDLLPDSRLTFIRLSLLAGG